MLKVLCISVLKKRKKKISGKTSFLKLDEKKTLVISMQYKKNISVALKVYMKKVK